MSRFDLIFVLTDEPVRELDEKIAEHILKSNYAGELASQKSSNPGVSKEELESAMKIIIPEIEPDLLRKYVAYARKNIFPTLSQEAMERLKRHYVSLRSSQAQESSKPVPVTPRHIEALVRLSEASARLTLNSSVTLEDAERAVRITYACLQKIGVDPETGYLDADIIATGISKTMRDKTRAIIDIIKDISKQYAGEAPEDQIFIEAERQGIARNKAQEIIERLRKDGQIFERKTGSGRYSVI
jgi:replicative DNA helicase Mcm